MSLPLSPRGQERLVHPYNTLEFSKRHDKDPKQDEYSAPGGINFCRMPSASSTVDVDGSFSE
jgi:hypothetical protein